MTPTDRPTGLQYWSEAIEKQCGERVMIALRDQRLRRVLDTLGPEVFRRSSVFHGLGDFLTQRKVRGRRCFEVGTWNGLTAGILAQFFDEVVTVDIANNPEKNAVLEVMGAKNVRCIHVADNEEKARIASNVAFDFAYLDGDHANDTADDFALVRRCGRVLFHEAWPHQPPVWDLLHQLPGAELEWNGKGLALWTSIRKG
jgi:hypothetical protein